ncbi:MAG: anthranilate synthase component II [Promethearchaeota archaeon]
MVLNEYENLFSNQLNSINFIKPLNDLKENILFINNKDSFVYNIVNYICQLAPNSNIMIEDNDIPLDYIEKKKINRLFISPGPGHPKHDTNNVIPIIKKYYTQIPILGICLGHQAIAEAFGELELELELEKTHKNNKSKLNPDFEFVGKAKVGPMHGKLSKTFHNAQGLFKDIPNPIDVVRYHSLAIKGDHLPSSLKITAMAEDGTIMAVHHKSYKVFGVQFHPESIMSVPFGILIIKNFLLI